MTEYNTYYSSESQKPNNSRIKLISILTLVGLILFLAIFKFFSIRKAMSMRPVFPPVAVSTIIAKASDWQDSLEIVGSLEPVQGTVLKAEEAGTITDINFESGQEVKIGTVLVQVDKSVETAQLQGAQATLELAQLNFNRSKLLFAREAISKANYDQVSAELAKANSEVARLNAVIKKKTIKAPFSGKTGIRQVNLGQFVASGTEIVPLFTHEQVFLDFDIPQQYFHDLKQGQEVTFTVDTFPGEEFKASVSAINPNVDSETRTVGIQALIDNKNAKLKSGMYANVKLHIGTAKQLISLPSSAIVHAPYGDSVFVVKNMKAADEKEFLGIEQVNIKVGPHLGDLSGVLSGLNPGDQVVTSGGFKLRPKSPVVVDNSVSPDANPKPVPEDK